MINGIDVEGIYKDHLLNENEINRNIRYKGKEKYYGGSSSGFCSRQQYYKAVAQEKKSNEPNAKSMRIMRLGTVWHDDMERALKNLPKEQYWMYNLKEIYFENEIILEDLNVRGHYDALFVTEDDEYLLYDFKTIGSFPWKLKFGRNNEKEEVNIKHELQVATYGIAIKRQYKRIDGLYLLYYNKDNSSMKQITVPMSRMDDAMEYWTSINEEHKHGLPEINLGISPVEKWECNYCDWHTLCSPQI